MSDNRGGNGGGGIAAEGPARVLGSTVDDNSAGGAVGGGVFDVGLIRHSTISGNRASSGGGVEVFPSLQVTITTSTLDANHSASYGGAIDESGDVTISRSTLARNSSGGHRFAGPGAAVEMQGGAQLQLSDSTVADNTTNPSCGLSLPTDLTGVQPDLGPLADNGGPTSTMALRRASPAVDAGGLPSTSGCPLVDQRGASRPWGPACDIGAFELHYPQPAR